MNKPFIRWIGICTAQLAITGLCHAQSKTITNRLLPPPSHIAVDGYIKEWGDSLRYYNKDKQLNYSLANDHDNLYMAIRINDRSEQIRILKAGLTLSIDTRGKKKESFSITFPVGIQSVDDMAQTADDLKGNGSVTQADRDELMKARLTKLREIRVSGFKDIEGETITTSNTYGIQTAMDYDKNGDLIYEAAIPLKFFHVDELTKNEWAFNFKINGIIRSGPNSGDTEQEGQGRSSRGGMGGGGGRGGRGGGMGGGRGGQRTGGGTADHSELSKSVDFWEKFYLAN